MSLARTKPWVVVAGTLVGLAAGSLTAFDSRIALALVAAVAGLFLAFTLPESLLLATFLFITLSGWRPFPPVLGFHVQAQYFLLLPMLLRSLLAKPIIPEAVRKRWRPLVLAAAAMVLASLISYGVDLTKPGFTTSTGNYIAWIFAFAFLAILARLAWTQKADFARALYSNLLNVIGLFAAYTLLGAIFHFQSVSQASSARLSFADLDPNQTGVIIVAGILLAIAPITIRRATARDFIWLPFLLPLLVLTGSRDSIAALAFGLIVLLFQRRSGHAAAWYLYAMVGVVGSVLAVVASDQSVVPKSLLRDFSYPEVAPYEHIFGIQIPHALAERVYIQVTAIHQIFQHPFLGIGFQQPLSIPEGTSSATWWGPQVILPVAHDAFLTSAAQQGIIGFLAFIAMVFVGLRTTRAAAREARETAHNYDIAVGVRCTVLAIVFTAFNNDSLYADFKILSIFFWLLVVAFMLRTPIETIPIESDSEPATPEAIAQARRPSPFLTPPRPAPQSLSPGSLTFPSP